MKDKIIDRSLLAIVIFLWIMIAGILIILINDMIQTAP
jgi:hypothetical protein